MAKAINWPERFLQEVLNEENNIPKIALRLGSLYFDTNYYLEGEIVDIRVNHKIIRRGKIIEPLKLSKISDLSQSEIMLYKNDLSNCESISTFLADNYSQDVKSDTIVTVIKYINLPLEDSEDVDDPHMC